MAGAQTIHLKSGIVHFSKGMENQRIVTVYNTDQVP